MSEDRIERDIVVEAPVERVWTLLTTSEHIQSWFAFDGAEIDLRPGGGLVMRWEEHGVFHAVVERVEAPSVFAFRWALVPDVAPEAGNSTLVEFTLAGEGEATRVRVVESGFLALDLTEAERREHYKGNVDGWIGALGGLADHVREVAAAP